MSLNKVAPLPRMQRVEPVCLLLSEVAEMVGGDVVGSENPLITGVAGIRDAESGDLTFLARRRYREALRSTRAAAVLVTRTERIDRPAVRVEDPAIAFMLVVRHFAAARRRPRRFGVHPTAVIDPTAKLGHEISIGPHVVVEAEVEIGDRSVVMAGSVVLSQTQIGSDCVLHPNVTIGEGTEIGNRVIVHAGAVIGGDGFGFVNDGPAIHKMPHIGRVVLEDDVEVGANTCIDRASTGTTRVRRCTKIDNLVQIAHNVQIGEYSIVCAQSGISGSTEVGRRVKLAGQSGLVGHITIGDDVTVGAQSGIIGNVPAAMQVSGYPAQRHRDALRQQAVLAQLPSALRELRQRLAALEAALETER